ncbi:MAG: HAMP domain-containing protein [Planctomycetes bacterium]|nr:HAMP domain-containing protein [Planctomycetota bacterium]
MSYRTLKRLIGEKSLERKCLMLFAVSLLLLITGSFWLYSGLTEQLVTKQNRTRGRDLVDKILLQTHWEQYTAKSDKAFSEVIKNQLGPILEYHDYACVLIRPNSRDPAHAPRDAWEVQELSRVPAYASTSEPPRPFGRLINGGKDYEYYQPIYASKGCINCHRAIQGPSNLAEGDLMAVARVQMSNQTTQRDQAVNRGILIGLAIITVFLAIVCAWGIIRYVIGKPLKHLRDVSDAVSKGETDQRAEIRTGDEFEELGNAFNRMLRHLLDAQQELQKVNSNLDVKVDQLAQANMQLFDMNRLKSDFLATMSHELRTPLNSIIGFSDVLSSISSLEDKQKRYVQNIQKSGRVLLDMINDILDLAKIESGKMDVRASEFRIDGVIAAQCDMARPLTEKKNIDLDVEIEPDLPTLFQDQGKVQQILNNLLSNAIKFTPEGGRIVVTARRGTNDELNLVVADTGVGIAEEDQVKVFEKFRQGSSVLIGGDAMTREHSGTGLGLSIVKELCKLLGGEISLHSELGKGSVFTVHLPWSAPVVPKVETPLADDLSDLTRARRIDYERTATGAVPPAA